MSVCKIFVRLAYSVYNAVADAFYGGLMIIYLYRGVCRDDGCSTDEHMADYLIERQTTSISLSLLNQSVHNNGVQVIALLG